MASEITQGSDIYASVFSWGTRTNSDKELTQRRNQVISRGIRQIYPVFVDHAENCRVWDVEGREYLDFADGVVVLSTGYLRPRVMVAVKAQLKKLSHTCFWVLIYRPYLELCEVVNQKVSGDFTKKTLLVMTGSEAVENTVKIVRAATKRSGAIALNSTYHGRTYYTLAPTGEMNPYSAGMGLMPGHTYRALYPYPLHGVSEDGTVASTHRIFKNDTTSEDIATIVIEPAQGEGGFYASSPAFMWRPRALCDEHGIILITGEVQSSAGHTDTLFVMEQMGVVPDLTIFVKSIIGDFLLADVIGHVEVADVIVPGSLGGTYADNPTACVTTLEVLKVFEQENLPQKASGLGQKLKDGLLTIVEKHPEIGDVYGLGMMTATGPSEDDDHNKPDAKLTTKIVARACDGGLILLSCGLYYNMLCILVPLTIEDAQTRQSLGIINQCLGEAKQQRRSHAGDGATRLVRPTGIQIG